MVGVGGLRIVNSLRCLDVELREKIVEQVVKMAPIRDSQIPGDYEEVGNNRPSLWPRWWMGWFD
jgi:hypothetical protein